MTPASPVKRLDMLPDAPETAAFRAVDNLLRGHPVLGNKDVVKNWYSREGRPKYQDFPQPAPGLCPFVALSPYPQADAPLTQSHDRVNFGIRVRVGVAGSCVDDLFNLWHQVRDALRSDRPVSADGAGVAAGTPGAMTVSAYLCSLGVPYLRPARQPYAEVLPMKNSGGADPNLATIGDGSVEMFFQTPA